MGHQTFPPPKIMCNVNLGPIRGVFFQDLGWRGGFFFRVEPEFKSLRM